MATPVENPLAVLLTGSILGCTFVWWGFQELKRKRAIEDTPTSKVRSMPLGPVELQGRAVATCALQSPFSNTPCVFYTYKVEEYVEKRQSDGKVTSEWQIREHGQSSEAFILEDETGRVSVHPDGAEAPIPQKEIRSTSASVSIGGLAFGTRPRRFFEGLIRAGDPLVVLGVATAPVSVSDGTSDAHIIRNAPGQLFVISNESAKMVARRLGLKALALIAAGGVIQAGTFYILSH